MDAFTPHSVPEQVDFNDELYPEMWRDMVTHKHPGQGRELAPAGAVELS